MKIYISASLEDVEKIKTLAKKLQLDGHTITFAWWEHNPQLHREKVIHCKESLKGIRQCEFFLFYNGNKKTSGKYVELGMALSEKKYIVGMGIKVSGIFHTMFNEWIDTSPSDSDTLYEIFTGSP